MRTVLVAGSLFAVGACCACGLLPAPSSTNDGGVSAPSAVSCAAPTFAPSADVANECNAGEECECIIDFAGCDDNNEYKLRCRDLNLSGVGDNGVQCLCDIDGVVGSAEGGGVGISDTTCAKANQLPPGRFSRAWAACGVDMIVGSR